VLPFSGVWNDGDVALSPDGRRLFFISNRPKPGSAEPKKDLDLWYVDRMADGRWGEPVRLPDAINTDVNEVYPSVASDGTIYFGRDGKIHRARFAMGRYQSPEPTGLDGFSFAIAPDQSIAVVGRPGKIAGDIDMYLVEQHAGAWSVPVRLSDAINSSASDLAGAFSANGRTFYFVSQRKSFPAAWPRSGRVDTYDEVRVELDKPGTGLRDIYEVSIEYLRAEG
jgi:Tol biopolymer transport system component